MTAGNIDDYSIRLQKLSSDYHENKIVGTEYRKVRKHLLDEIVEKFNGRIVTQLEECDPTEDCTPNGNGINNID